MLSEAELIRSKRSIFFNKTEFLLNFIFPKEPDIVRVRNSAEARAVNKVVTLDFVSILQFFFNFSRLISTFSKTISVIKKKQSFGQKDFIMSSCINDNCIINVQFLMFSFNDRDVKIIYVSFLF